MIDIHSHIIPGVDDGSGSIEESLKMLRSAVRQGVTAIMATSHSDAFLFNANLVSVKYKLLQDAVKEKGIPITLGFGTELYCSVRYIEENLELLNSGTYPTMNGTDYVLAEFSTRVSEENAVFCLTRLQEGGYRPILAHAERCAFIDEHAAESLRERGIFFQINVYSVKEEKDAAIRNRANMLLRKGLADFAGSDAHRMIHRPPAYTEGIKHMYREYDHDYIDKVLIHNPQKCFFEIG